MRTLSGVLLALAIGLPATAQETTAEPQPVEPQGEETATGVELFNFEGEAGATGEILEAEARADRALEAGLLRVGDLQGRPVLGEGGEIIGEIGRIVRWDGRVWAVLESGGFLGIGDDDVPVEVRRLAIGPDFELHAPGLSEDAVEDAGDIDLEGAEDVEPDVSLRTSSE